MYDMTTPGATAQESPSPFAVPDGPSPFVSVFSISGLFQNFAEVAGLDEAARLRQLCKSLHESTAEFMSTMRAMTASLDDLYWSKRYKVLDLCLDPFISTNERGERNFRGVYFPDVTTSSDFAAIVLQTLKFDSKLAFHANRKCTCVHKVLLSIKPEDPPIEYFALDDNERRLEYISKRERPDCTDYNGLLFPNSPPNAWFKKTLGLPRMLRLDRKMRNMLYRNLSLNKNGGTIPYSIVSNGAQSVIRWRGRSMIIYFKILYIDCEIISYMYEFLS